MDLAIIFIVFLFAIVFVEARRKKYLDEYLRRNRNLRNLKKRVDQSKKRTHPLTPSLKNRGGK